MIFFVFLTGRKTKCWKSIPTCFELIFIFGGQSKLLAANYVADDKTNFISALLVVDN